MDCFFLITFFDSRLQFSDQFILFLDLAVLDYDNEDLALFSYDWRLSFGNLEVRDSYFSNLKNRIEFSKRNLGKKTTLVAHSMGSLVVLYFFKWVELESNDDRWVENHISNFSKHFVLFPSPS